MISPSHEKEVLQDLERMIWIHFEPLRPPCAGGTIVDEVDDRWRLSRFGDRIIVSRGGWRLICVDRHKKLRRLEHYNFPTCVKLLERLKALHPLEALADI